MILTLRSFPGSEDFQSYHLATILMVSGCFELSLDTLGS